MPMTATRERFETPPPTAEQLLDINWTKFAEVAKVPEPMSSSLSRGWLRGVELPRLQRRLMEATEALGVKAEWFPHDFGDLTLSEQVRVLVPMLRAQHEYLLGKLELAATAVEALAALPE